MRSLIALPLAILLLACGAGTPPPAASTRDAALDFSLDYERLAGPLAKLEDADRDAVQDSIGLIQNGEHTLALSRLASLNEKNPRNTSLHILTSYALLQAGNLVGAFEEAEKAHEAPDRIAYKCWFLGKVALLAGRRAVSEREVKHLHAVGDMLAEARQLESEIEKN